MTKYKHIFFDLDRTLWDYDACAHATMRELQRRHPEISGVDTRLLNTTYEKHSELGWEQYRRGTIKKADMRMKRFRDTLLELGVNNDILADTLSAEFIELCPSMPYLVNGARELLEYLRPKYSLHILTNGFNDIQFRKMRSSNIEKYFERVITSDTIGYVKPGKEIFHAALSSVRAVKDSTIMIGDDYPVDILGAMGYGIDQIWLNLNDTVPEKKPTFEIKKLHEIYSIL